MIIYSAYSGQLFEIADKDFKHMIPGQFPLKKKPNTSCSKCHSRGFVGRDTKNFFFYLCSCVKKVVDDVKIAQQEHDQKSKN